MTEEELKEAVKFVKDYTGLDPANAEEFKKGFAEKFFTEKDITSNKKLTGIATGFLSGKLTTKLKRDFKLEAAEIEGKSIEEIIDLTIQKSEAEKDELKKQIGEPAEGLKDLQSQLEKSNLALQQEKEAKKAALKALEEKDKEYTQKEFNREKSDFFKSVLDKVKKGEEGKRKPLIALAEEQEHFFNVKINETFDFAKEDGKWILTDKEGKKIPNPNKAGEFLEPEDGIYNIAEQRKYVQNNPGGKVEKDILDFGKKPEQAQQPGVKERVLPTKALEAAERLKALDGQR